MNNDHATAEKMTALITQAVRVSLEMNMAQFAPLGKQFVLTVKVNSMLKTLIHTLGEVIRTSRPEKLSDEEYLRILKSMEKKVFEAMKEAILENAPEGFSILTKE